jgi:hypothetical protein
MSDQPAPESTTTETAASTDAQPEASAPAAPVIDEAALAQSITSSVTESVAENVGKTVDERVNVEVEKRMKETFSKLAGGDAKPEPHALHKAFATTPAELFEENRKIAKEEILRELKAEKQNEQECLSTMEPVYNKVPELKKYANEVRADFDAVASLEANRGKTDAQILEQSLKRTVERLGLKELSDDEVARNATLPSASGAGYPQGASAPIDSDQAAADFIQQGRDRFRSLRVRKAN